MASPEAEKAEHGLGLLCTELNYVPVCESPSAEDDECDAEEDEGEVDGEEGVLRAALAAVLVLILRVRHHQPRLPAP